MKKKLNIPEFIPIPPVQYDSYITMKKSTMIIIMLIIMGVSILYITFYSSTNETRLKVVCQNEVICDVNKNNIQASHTYELQYIKQNNNSLILDNISNLGLLWGSSMQPTFFEGNTAVVKEYNNMTLHTGDIIRYFRFSNKYPNCTSIKEAIGNNSLGGSWINNDMAVLHRINAVYDNLIVVQGDNLNQVETIDKCQVTDIVIGIIFT